MIFDEQLRLWRTGDRVSATGPRVAAPKHWMPIFFTAGTNSRNYGNSSRAVKEELAMFINDVCHKLTDKHQREKYEKVDHYDSYALAWLVNSE